MLKGYLCHGRAAQAEIKLRKGTYMDRGNNFGRTFDDAYTRYRRIKEMCIGYL